MLLDSPMAKNYLVQNVNSAVVDKRGPGHPIVPWNTVLSIISLTSGQSVWTRRKRQGLWWSRYDRCASESGVACSEVF